MVDLEKGRQPKIVLEWSTFKFFCLCVATLNVFYYAWVWKLVNKASDEYTLHTNRVLAILYIAFAMWGTLLGQNIFTVEFGGLLNLAGWILVIVLSFRVRPSVEKYLAANGTPLRLGGFWTFIFPFLYQYYVIYNAKYLSEKERAAQLAAPQPAPQPAPQQDVVAKLQKLQELKNSGAISERQYEAAKRKLLGA